MQTGIWAFAPSVGVCPWGSQLCPPLLSSTWQGKNKRGGHSNKCSPCLGPGEGMTCTRGRFLPPLPLWELVFIRHLLHARLCSEAATHGLISPLPRLREERVSPCPLHRLGYGGLKRLSHGPQVQELEQVGLTPSPAHSTTQGCPAFGRLWDTLEEELSWATH